MKTFYEIKNISNTVADVDTVSRRVKVAISEMGSKDLDNDVIDTTAYNKTIPERGPKGAGLIWHLTDHIPSLKNAVGRFSELNVDGNKLIGVTDIPNTTWGNDVMEFYKSGHINQHSIGFKTVKNEIMNKGKSDEYNLIKEILLYEGSAVLWGANPNTPTISAGKSLTKDEADKEVGKLTEELAMLTKSLRDGRFTDNGFELLDIRFNQLSERIKNIFAAIEFTQPVQTVEPKKKADYSTILQALKN